MEKEYLIARNNLIEKFKELESAQQKLIEEPINIDKSVLDRFNSAKNKHFKAYNEYIRIYDLMRKQ